MYSRKVSERELILKRRNYFAAALSEQNVEDVIAKVREQTAGESLLRCDVRRSIHALEDLG